MVAKRASKKAGAEQVCWFVRLWREGAGSNGGREEFVVAAAAGETTVDASLLLWELRTGLQIG